MRMGWLTLAVVLGVVGCGGGAARCHLRSRE